MTKLDELVAIVDQCIQHNDIVCDKIRNKRKEIANYREKYLIAKTTGTTLGIIGGAGLMLAPFTAGTSLLLSLGAGAAGTVAGIGVNLVTDRINSKETKEFIEDLNRFNTSRNEDLKELTQLMDELSDIIQRHVDLGMTTEQASGVALGEFGGYADLVSCGAMAGPSPLCGTVGLGLLDAPATLTVAMHGTLRIVYSFAQTAKMELSAGAKVLGLAGQGLNVAKGTFKGVAVAAGVVFIAIDVGLLIKDFAQDNQATGAAYKIEEQIQEQTKTLTEFRDELREYVAQLQLVGRRQLTSTSYEDDDECICRPIKISVLYCNMQSANPAQANKAKLQKFKGMVQARRPNIVALVETWLSSKHSDQDVKAALGLEQYEIFRNDRCDNDPSFAGDGDDPIRENERRGGGCLVAWLRDGLAEELSIPGIEPESGFARHRMPTIGDITGRTINFSREQFPTRTYSSNDNLQSFTIDCAFNCGPCNQGRKCFSHSFRVMYRRPKAYRQAGYKEEQDQVDFELLDRELTEQMCDHYEEHVGGIIRGGYLGGVIVGDFNWSTGMTDEVAGRIQEVGLENIPIPGRTINKGDKENPDMVFDFNGIVEQPVENLGFVSDHAALYFNLKLGKDYDYESPCSKCVD